MALLFGRQRRELTGSYVGANAADLIPARSASPLIGTAPVTTETSLRHSAVWACLRLRANLVSTMPVDVFRRVGGIQVEMPKPRILTNPGGERVDWVEWMYSTQVDLDRAGNAIGLITERNAAGLPDRIDLQPIDACSLRTRKGVTKWRIDGEDYELDQVWHEKQYTVAGLAVGLSPLAYAAWSVGEYLSIQDFALTWFGNGGTPRSHLKNKMQTISSATAAAVKQRFKETTAAGDVFVTGADWEFEPLQSQQTGMEWLEAKRYGVGDIARFFDCPGDLIDAATQSGNITYANVTQRNMQFLTMHLGPAIARREQRLSRLLPQPRYVKLNTSALLRMDDAARAEVLKTRIDSRTLTPSEARELENKPPLTEAQMAEFDRLFGDPRARQRTTTSLQDAGGPSP